MKKKVFALIFLFLVINVFSYTQTVDVYYNINQSEWQILRGNNYSIRYPGNWEVDRSGNNNTDFILLSSSSYQDNFRENVNLIIKNYRGLNYNLDKIIANENFNYPASELLFNKRQRFNGLEFHKVVFTLRQDDLILLMEQRYYFHNDKAYLLTGGGEKSEFENFKIIVNKIMNSFTLH